MQCWNWTDDHKSNFSFQANNLWNKKNRCSFGIGPMSTNRIFHFRPIIHGIKIVAVLELDRWVQIEFLFQAKCIQTSNIQYKFFFKENKRKHEEFFFLINSKAKFGCPKALFANFFEATEYKLIQEKFRLCNYSRALFYFYKQGS